MRPPEGSTETSEDFHNKSSEIQPGNEDAAENSKENPSSVGIVECTPKQVPGISEQENSAAEGLLGLCEGETSCVSNHTSEF